MYLSTDVFTHQAAVDTIMGTQYISISLLSFEFHFIFSYIQFLSNRNIYIKDIKLAQIRLIK